jgi:hypothetical protein
MFKFIVPKRSAGERAAKRKDVSMEMACVKTLIPPRNEYLFSDPKPVRKSKKGSIPMSMTKIKSP